MRILFLLLSSVFVQAATLPLPPENKKVVQGFQDGFNGLIRRVEWMPIGAAGDVYEQADGVIHIKPGPGVANHLALQGNYDPSTQEILARMRVVATDWGDLSRGGVGLAVDSVSSEGLNFHFRYMDIGSEAGLGPFTKLRPGVNPYLPETDPLLHLTLQAGNSFNHMELHNDRKAWGPELYVPWQTNTYYWIRMRHELNMGGAANDLFAKMWKADGVATEPANWQVMWNYDSPTTIRSGLAGLAGTCLDGFMELDCDYVLIMAQGLPSITVGGAEFLNVVPADKLTTHPAEKGITFTVLSPYDIDKVEITVNGVNETAKFVSTGNACEKNFVYKGLLPEKDYEVRITASAVSGVTVEKKFSFGTYIPITEIQILSPLWEQGQPSFTFVPLPGKSHIVQYRASLTTGDWESAPVLMTGPENGVMRVVDPTPKVEGFYRVMAQ